MIYDYVHLKDYGYILNPIPLTEEILLKCGSCLDRAYYILTPVEMRYSYKRKEFCVFFNTEVICCIKYLHQLQNLYFALTGKELEVKL